MAEKEAKGFGLGDKTDAFQLNKPAEVNIAPQAGQAAAVQNAPGAPVEKRIVLNIAEAKGSKILLRQAAGTIRYTGNPVLDAYQHLNDYIIEHSKIKLTAKATFFRLLAVMLNAGLSLIRSLNTLAVQQDKTPRLARVLFAMANTIEGGRSLSDAMGDYPDVFDDSQVGVVKAGEASGQLNRTLKSLADEMEKSASVSGKIKGAMIYPAVIMSILIVVVFLMMTMVIPQLSSLFASSGKELPLPTVIMVWISNFCLNYWYVLIGGIVGTVIGFNVWKKTRSGKFLWDAAKLKFPVFGPVVQKGAISKFARGFANLMSSGVPIIKAMEIISHAVGNEVYKRRLMLCAEDMKRGIPMAENMAESKLFPSMLVNMIEVGEQTAQLDTVILKVADFYDDEIDEIIKNISKTMEPMIMVVMGVVIGGIVAAIMLPIMQLTSFAGNV
jgi:type IV pilus assembly protein PilC